MSVIKIAAKIGTNPQKRQKFYLNFFQPRGVSFLLPRTVGVSADVSVVISTVSCHFLPQKSRLLIGFVNGVELYLCEYQTVIFSMKLVYLYYMFSRLDKPACFLYSSWQADVKELPCFFHGDLFLPLVASNAAGVGGTLYSKVCLLVAKSDAHRSSVVTTDVGLQYLGAAVSECLVAVVSDEEFSFYLHIAELER